MENRNWLVVHPEKSEYLMCNDGRWRSFVHFGSMSTSVKEYQSQGWAQRRARKLAGIDGPTHVSTVSCWQESHS